MKYVTFFKHTEFFLAEMKAQGDEGGGRILLGDNTGGGVVMLRPSKFQRVVIRISSGLPYIYIYNILYI
jgi:hypothetical protein